MRRARMFVRVIRAIQVANVIFAGVACVGFFLPWITSGPCTWCETTEPTVTMTGWTIATTYVGVFDVAMIHFWLIVALSLATLASTALAFRWRGWNTLEIFFVSGAATVWYSLELGFIINSGGIVTHYSLGGILQFVCYIACFILSAIVFSTRSRVVTAVAALTPTAP